MLVLFGKKSTQKAHKKHTIKKATHCLFYLIKKAPEMEIKKHWIKKHSPVLVLFGSKRHTKSIRCLPPEVQSAKM